MTYVSPREGESQEALVGRFTKLVQREGVLREFRSRRFFMSKPQQRRIAIAKAARRRARRANRMNRR